MAKPLSDFGNRSDKKHLFKSQCRQCDRDYANLRNSDPARRSALRDKHEALRAETRRFVYEYFVAHPCADCGADDWRVLEFDHVRGEKLFNVCEIMAKPVELVVAEVEKCESVCANCHKLRTYKRANSWRITYAK